MKGRADQGFSTSTERFLHDTMKKSNLDVWIVRTSEHFKEVLKIPSAQMKQELQYFIATNNVSLEMLFFEMP